MLFSSMTFLFIFLPVVIVAYFLVPKKMKNFILLIASLFFYAWGEPIYIGLMVLSILLNYFCGRDIEEKRQDPVRMRQSLIFAIVSNLLILGFFKYFGLLVETVNGILPINIPYRELALPIGISFYTFQAISYIMDVYRGEAKAQKNILNFALYISMFPQLIAGPIVRYTDIERQLAERTINAAKFGSGVMFFVRGLAKKIILANVLGQVYQEVAAMQIGSFSVLTAWVGCISYAFQIYFDFGGYSDMAIGLGRMLGFEFRKNFDYPYISTSITEFWRRWHISLSTWFREYVYIPLGGNRCSTSRHILNLMIVWALTGIWHGAAWNFMFWGIYYGLLLVAEKYLWGRLIERLPGSIQHVYALVLVLIGWVFFFSPQLGYAFDFIGVMFGSGATALVDQQSLFLIGNHWVLYLLAFLGSTSLGYTILSTLLEIPNGIRGKKISHAVIYVGMFLISLAFLVTETYNPFLYFRF